MISIGSIQEGLRLALTLARGRTDISSRFDLSDDAVWRSLWAIPLALPANLLLLETQLQLARAEPTLPGSQFLLSFSPRVFLVALTVIFLASWAGEVFVLNALARKRGVDWRASPLIIAFNWSKFAYMTFMAVITFAALAVGVDALVPIVQYAAIGVLLWVRWGVFRATLGFRAGGIFGVMALLVLISVAAALSIMAILSVLGLFPELPMPS